MKNIQIEIFRLINFKYEVETFFGECCTMNQKESIVSDECLWTVRIDWETKKNGICWFYPQNE